MTLGQRVAVIRDGVVQQCDEPQVLFDRPANVFVGAFIGSPAMNLVQARLEGGRATFADATVEIDGLGGHPRGHRPRDPADQLRARRRPDRSRLAADAGRGRRGRAARRRVQPALQGRRAPGRDRGGQGRDRRRERRRRGPAAGRRRSRPLQRPDPQHRGNRAAARSSSSRSTRSSSTRSSSRPAMALEREPTAKSTA